MIEKETKREIQQSIYDKVINASFIVILLLVLVFLFTGCSTTNKKPEPTVIVKHEVTERVVTVMPEIPYMYCDFTGRGVEPISKLLKCLVDHKTVLDQLREQSIKHNKNKNKKK